MGAKAVRPHRPPQKFCFNLINDEERAVLWGEEWREYADRLEALLQQAVDRQRIMSFVFHHDHHIGEWETCLHAPCLEDRAVLAAAAEVGIRPNKKE